MNKQLEPKTANENPVTQAPQTMQKISVQHVAFVKEVSPTQKVIVELQNPVNRKAIFQTAEGGTQSSPNDFQLMTIAVPDTDNPEWIATAKDWIGETSSPIVLLTLQGTQIFWTAGRVAVIAKPERVETIQKAITETTWYESELRAVETELQQGWDTLGADAPLAFEFAEKAIRQRPQLMKRFQQVVALRAKLARMTPHILAPVIYPPTLASQIGERLRERTRMPDRIEFAENQLEVYERVYETCSQRSSDYMLSRSSNTLEWFIIILLFIQIMLTVVDLLSHSAR